MNDQRKTKENKNTTNYLRILLLLFLSLLIGALLCFSVAAQPEDTEDQLEELKNCIKDNPNYSSFQKSMILDQAVKMIQSGISFEDTENMIQVQMDNSVNAYSMKKIFDTLLESQQKGLPTKTLINKLKEGLAKKVDINLIYEVLQDKSMTFEEANEMLSEVMPVMLSDSEEMNNSSSSEQMEIIEIIADSLSNGLPQGYLSYLVQEGTQEGKTLKEIAQVSAEMGTLSLQASEIGLSQQDIKDLLATATNDSQGIGQVCENMQGLLLEEQNKIYLAQSNSVSTSKDQSNNAAASTTGDSSESDDGDDGDDEDETPPADEELSLPDTGEPSLPDTGISPAGDDTKPGGPSDSSEDENSQYQPPEN